MTEILEKIRKNTTKEELRRGVQDRKKIRTRCLNCVMLGFYWDTPATVEETMQFAFELNAEFHPDVGFLLLCPAPIITRCWRRITAFFQKSGRAMTACHHSSVKLPNISNEQLNRYLATFYRRYYRRRHTCG